MSGPPDPALYRPNVGIALFNPAGLVWLGKRIAAPPPYQWQMPQGGMDAAEAPRDAALRELEEETGAPAALTAYLGETPDWLYYDIPPEFLNKSRGQRYKGQRQKWFALRYLGADEDIRLDGHAPEFSDWRWATLDEAVELVIPFKRAVYGEAARQFRRFATGGA
jgi:putative (di)nucleoside polyphosphate hydrolase